MNGNPTAEQQRWHNWLRERGCAMSLRPPEIHHIGGSKMKLKGFNDQKPGEWYVIPLWSQWHQLRHQNKAMFINKAGYTEKQLFEIVVEEYEMEHGEKPMPEDLFNALIERA